MQNWCEEVIELLHETLTLKPDHPEANYSLGIAIHQQGDRDNAVTEFRTVIQLKDNYLESHNNHDKSLKKQGNLTAP